MTEFIGQDNSFPPLDDEYDVILLGTGLKTCILSGLLAVDGFKVCNVDTNSYYGGESATLGLVDVFKMLDPENVDQASAVELGRARDYLVDLCPKFIMSAGNLTKCLIQSKVTPYLEFRGVRGSFVYKDGVVHKVPSTASEALNSGLMGIFQKRKFKNFLQWVQDYDRVNPYQDAAKTRTRDVFDYWGLDLNTQTFIGHAMALHRSDAYLDEMFLPTLNKIKLYAYSVTRFGNSPYIYPMWGLGGLPEGFARLCAINNGVQMLRAPLGEIAYESTGQVTSVVINDQVVKCKQLIADPSYFVGTPKVKKVGQIACWLFILDHPIEGTNGADSCQIIIPFRQTGRKTDLYISCLSSAHSVAPKGKFLAMITGQVESSRVSPQQSMMAARELLGRAQKE